jgi:hypothetical protein
MTRHHLVISGTGRAGTTFLVELFTHLGLQTGFKPEELHLHRDKRSRAGLELDIRHEGCPYIVKSPDFCDQAEAVLGRSDIVIDHVLVPIRHLHAAAESRRFVTREALSELPPLRRIVKSIFRPHRVRGGLWKTKLKWRQEKILLEKIYSLALALADSAVPVTLLRFPRIVKDCNYLFTKLRPVLSHTSPDHFHAAFHRVSRPDLVHSFIQRDA